MANVRVVTDSASDLLPETAAMLGITVIPLSVHFGEQTFIDGVDLEASDFYHRLNSDPHFPRTSQPSIGRFEELYARLRDDGSEIVSVHLSSKLSGTFDTASLAARNTEGAAVQLIDSLTVSMALGELAIAAALWAREGLPAVEIAARTLALRDKLHVTIMLDNLGHLQRGGRIGRAQGMIGALLNIKPIVGLHDGLVVPQQRVRTTARAIVEMTNEARGFSPLKRLRIMHSNAPKLVTELLEALRPLVPGQEIPVQLLGPVIGTHAGSGAVGCVIFQD